MTYVPLSRTGVQAKGGYVPLAQAVPTQSARVPAQPIDVGLQPSLTTKTSTQAIPDATTPNITPNVALNFAKDVGQTMARSVASTALTVSKKIDPAADTFKPEDFSNFFTQGVVETVFGKDPNKAIEDRIVEAEPKVKAWGEELRKLAETPGLNARERLVTKTLADLATNHPSSLAFTGIMGSVGLDLSPFGGLEKNAFKAFVGAKTEMEALQVLTKMGVSDDLARQFAPDVVKVMTEAQAKKLFSGIAKLQETTKPVAKGTYVPLAEQARRIANETPGVRLADELTPQQTGMAESALKYAKEQKAPVTDGEITLYHGTDAARAPKQGDTLRIGTYFTTDEATARKFAMQGEGSKPIVMKIQVPAHKVFAGKQDGYWSLNEPTLLVTDFYKTKPIAKEAGRVNTKLEKMAAESSTFSDFYNKSGVTMESLEATAKGKGYKNANEFYVKNSAKGVAPGPVVDAELASLDRVAQTMGRERDNLPPLPKLAPSKLADETATAKTALEEARLQRDMGREIVPDMPGKPLMKYVSRETGELPEVRGDKTYSGKKIKQGGKFSQRGDVLVQDFGFKDLDEADEAIKDYRKAKAQLDAAERSVSARVKDYRDRKAVYDEVVRFVKEEGKARRDKVKMVQDFFKLSSKEVDELLKGERDIRLMSDGEFDDFLKRFEGKATESYLRMQDMVELKATIFDKEFVKLDNLRQAMKLPRIENMTPDQLRQFNEALQEFKVGDEFLGVRQLETVKNTNLEGIHTIREARERLLTDINALRERKGLAPVAITDLENVKVNGMDKFRYDTSLARRNPLYELMVHETHKSMLNADAVVFEVKDRVNELLSAARASRSTSVLDKLIPTDKRIFEWLEAPEAQKMILAKELTKEELEAAMYVRAWYAEARDYLVQQQTLKRYISDYITHIRRGFLEAWYEGTKKTAVNAAGGKGPGVIERTGTGLMAALKEAFKAYKDEEAFFNILNEKTGEVLPLEKFFQFSLKRTGELIPTKNVASAFLKYVSTFEKKKALDGLIPKLDIYVHSLTPKKLTPKGLEFDDSLKRFFKQWMNTKKGRPADLGFLKPGDKLDWAMRTGVAFTRILDLGLSLPVGIASNFGAQMAVYRGIGTKAYALGTARRATKEGGEILDKYRNLVGESVRTRMGSADASLGDNLLSGVFGLFAFADRKAREAFLLGSLTKAEYATKTISPDRLADLKLELGRHLPVENMQSIIGKTALGKVGTQYKTWAVPLLSSTLDDLSKLSTAVKKGDTEFIKSKEFAELLRTAILTSVVGLGVYGIVNDKTPMKERTFLEKMATKAAQDSLSLIGALDPSFWTSPSRLQKFIFDLTTGIKQIVTLEQNKSGEMTGVNTIERTLTPGVVKQVISTAEDATANDGGLPGLPQLPKIGGGLPKLPKLR